MRKNTKESDACQAPAWIKVVDAAKRFGVHHSTIYCWERDGRVRSMRHTGYRPGMLVSVDDMAKMTGRGA